MIIDSYKEEDTFSFGEELGKKRYRARFTHFAVTLA